jgi:hypothetical protein
VEGSSSSSNHDGGRSFETPQRRRARGEREASRSARWRAGRTCQLGLEKGPEGGIWVPQSRGRAGGSVFFSFGLYFLSRGSSMGYAGVALTCRSGWQTNEKWAREIDGRNGKENERKWWLIYRNSKKFGFGGTPTRYFIKSMLRRPLHHFLKQVFTGVAGAGIVWLNKYGVELICRIWSCVKLCQNTP